MRRADLVGKAEPFQRLQSTHADRLIEGVTPVRTGEHVRLRVADQCAVDAGQSFLPDLSTQPLLDRVIVARAQIKIDQLAGALAQAMADIVTRNDQILPAVVLAAQDGVSVGWPVLKWSTATQSSRVPRSSSIRLISRRVSGFRSS